MKLRIANLGVIKEATFDLSKKLTVFCGPNGTGKTYAAYIIYAVTDSIEESHFNFSGKRAIDVDELMAKGKIDIELKASEIFNYRKEILQRVAKSAGGLFALPEQKLQELFGNLTIASTESETEFALKYKRTPAEIIYDIMGPKMKAYKKPNTTTVTIELLEQPENPKQMMGLWRHWAYDTILLSLGFHPISSSIILPVERNSINTFSKELSLQKQAIFDQVQEIATAGKASKSIGQVLNSYPRYPRPIRDALTIAEDLANISKVQGEYFDFATQIEEEILNGAVIIGKEGEVMFASNKAKSKKLSFHLTSSSVKTITSLIIYLKHIAQKNDLIIIDEPELNLHPDNQIRIARLFARLINNGLRLLISTHSDYIIRELNNLIMLSSDEPALKKVASDFGYRLNEYIDKKDIGVYLFNFKTSKSRNVIVEEVEVANNGFEVNTIENTINSLNAASEEIFYTMKYGYQHHGDN